MQTKTPTAKILACFFVYKDMNVIVRFFSSRTRVLNLLMHLYNAFKILLMEKLLNFLNNKYPLDSTRVVQKYDEYLQYALLTTASFRDIVAGKVNPRNRFRQNVLLCYYFVYFIPRYSFLSWLYFQKKEKRIHYQNMLADYAEEIGLLGRTFNVCYLLFTVGILLNTLVVRRYQSTASLEFLTDWLKMTQRNQFFRFNHDINQDMNKRLISELRFKLIAAKLLARGTNVSICLYEISVCGIFLYKERPSVMNACLALFNCLTICLCFEYPGNHFHALYLSFVVTTDYFRARIKRFLSCINTLRTSDLTNQNIALIVDDYNDMVLVFKKYDKVMKHLLRIMVKFYTFGLTATFFMFTIDTEAWMLAIMIMSAAGYSLILLGTGVYISQLHSQVFGLHNTLVSLCARHAGDKRHRLSPNCIFRLKHIIQELGSLETDGQFVIGLRDGDGAATSRMQIFNLTLTTIFNTFMMMRFVDQN